MTRRRVRPGRNWSRPVTVGVVLLLTTAAAVVGAGNATASPSAGVQADAQAAADTATAAGYRTGIAVLDLTTGAYYGAGDDTGAFASESVAKVLIATELLLDGQMTGDTATTAYQMITESDDDDADALYGQAGGDAVITDVANHYGISDLGTGPSQPGWWGNTEITAKGLVQLYAAIAKDPVVGPWLTNAMAHTTEDGADGTYQFFGIPSATTGAAVKQGWGDDGDDSPNAVFDSTGYVDGNTVAVAILTDGPPDTYGSAISAMLTSEAKALMPSGTIDEPARHNPSVSGVAVAATGNTVHVTGTATDPDATTPITVDVDEGTTTVGTGTTVTGGGFDIAVHAADGPHSYTVVVPNVGEGTADATSAATAVTVDGQPTGRVTAVTGGARTITISGRDIDPNLAPGEDPDVVVTVDGHTVHTVPVDEPTPHATATGTTHTALASTPTGYTLVVPAPVGHDRVSVTYLGTDGAPNVAQGTYTAVVRAVPDPLRRVVLIAAIAIVVVFAGALLLINRRARARVDRPARPGRRRAGVARPSG